MAAKKATKTESKTSKVPVNEVQKKKQELFALRMKVLAGEQKNTSLIRKARKEIARLLTETNKQQTTTHSETE